MSMNEPRVRLKGSASMTARDAVLKAWKRWRSKDRETPLGASQIAFCEAYNADAVKVAGDVRSSCPHVGCSTLRRWLSASSTAAPKRRGRKPSISEPVAELIVGMLMKNPRHVTVRQVLDGVEARYGDDAPGIAAIRRFMAQWRADHAVEIAAVSDPDRFRSHFVPAFGDADQDVTAVGDRWELDSTICDVMCSDGKRYAITCCVDVFSRMARVHVAPTSSSRAIAAVMRRCLVDWGVPAHVVTDEGKDYVSNHVSGICEDLQIAHEILPPFSPELKPFVERFIGTLSRDLFARLPGFTGHNVADATALRNRKAYAARRGEDQTITYKCDLSPSELQARIDAWVDNDYSRRVHQGIETSPFLRFNSCTAERTVIDDDRALDIILMPPVPSKGGKRRVGKDGIKIDGFDYGAAELADVIGQTVKVKRDPDDPTTAVIFAAKDIPGFPGRPSFQEGEFICFAFALAHDAILRKRIAVKAKKRGKKRAAEVRKYARELERTLELANLNDEVAARKAGEAAKVVPMPSSAKTKPADAPAVKTARKAASGKRKTAREARSENGTHADTFGDGLSRHETKTAMFKKFLEEAPDGATFEDFKRRQEVAFNKKIGAMFS